MADSVFEIAPGTDPVSAISVAPGIEYLVHTPEPLLRLGFDGCVRADGPISDEAIGAAFRCGFGAGVPLLLAYAIYKLQERVAELEKQVERRR